MTDEEQLRAGNHAQHQKALLVRWVLFIKELDSELVIEDGPRLIEGDLVLFRLIAALGGSHSNLIIRTLHVCHFQCQGAVPSGNLTSNIIGNERLQRAASVSMNRLDHMLKGPL